MSKLVIVLFAVLTVVTTNASRTPEELQKYHREIEEKNIDGTKSYITKEYDDAVERHDALKNNVENDGAQKLANANDHIMTIINEAREQIENLKDGVELLGDETCLYHAAHLADKTAEASTNLTNCVSNKSKVSTDIEFGYITDAKRTTLYEAENFRDALNSCMDNNKSDADEAERCLFHVQVETLRLRSAIDVAVTRHMTRIREMFASAAQLFDFCENKYGAPNYSKFTTSIVNKVAKCFATGEHARRIREVPPVRIVTGK